MSRFVRRCAGLIVPTMVVSRSGFVKVKRRMNSIGGHAVEQVIEMCPTPALPLQPSLFSLSWRALCRTTTDNDTCTLLSGNGDRSFVFTLDCRVRNLKDVEDAHRNVVDQVRQGARHADKSNLAGVSECEECIERAVLLERLPGRRGMELHDIEIVGFHPRKTLLDPGHDILARENVGSPLAAWCRRRAYQTPAFALAR